jgi:hypothetical protein
MHKHTHRHTHIDRHIHIQTHRHTYTHRHTHTDIHTDTHIYTQTHTQIQTHRHRDIHIQIDKYTHKHIALLLRTFSLEGDEFLFWVLAYYLFLFIDEFADIKTKFGFWYSTGRNPIL